MAHQLEKRRATGGAATNDDYDEPSSKANGALLAADDDDDEEEVVVELKGPMVGNASSSHRVDGGSVSGATLEVCGGVSFRMMVTICECAGFGCLGLILSLLGPTLLDLGMVTGGSVSEMGYVFTARSCGYLLGSIVGGELFDRVRNSPLMLALTMLVTMLAGALVPWATTVGVLAFVVSFQGIAMGFLDTGGNVLLLRIWGKHVGPYMQTLHFSFGLGAFLAPFIAAGFIVSSPEEHTEHCGGEDQSTTTNSPLTTTSVPEVYSGNVQWAYWIAAALMLPVCLSFLWLARIVNKDKSKRLLSPSNEESSDGRKHQGLVRYILLGLGFLFFLVYVGLEVSYGGLIFTYSVQNCDLRFVPSEGALLTSAFWGAFAAGRLLAIPLSMYFRPSTLMIADLAGSTFAAILMAANPGNASVIWGGSIIYGVSMASIFPSGLHMLESFIDISGRAASLIVVGAATGEMVMPLMITHLFEIYGPSALMTTTAAGCCLAAGVFVILAVIGSCIRPKAVKALYVQLDEDAVVQESIELRDATA